ncbi:hypothetical protein C7M84_011143 [Penaeus vannamei]|uniref:Chitin-binding type-2 domain-containing protein n=1 Tax=Penaeus vannamei TaxID=6689 RepID=A0A3R7PLP6_PENVA|nr:hypothetical protein C7M84_011143 [Penaeus vannamei]
MKFLSYALLVFLTVSPGEQVCAPDCSGVDPGVRVRDPTDFTRYYICLDVDGSGNLLPSSDSVQCPPGEFFNDAHTPCPDCSRYYVCLADGLAIEHDCEAGYYFDYKTGMCSEDDSYCYQYCDPCKPHCTHVYQRVPDPYNCTKCLPASRSAPRLLRRSGRESQRPDGFTRYYICLDVDGSGNLLPSSDSVQCPPGEFFKRRTHLQPGATAIEER